MSLQPEHSAASTEDEPSLNEASDLTGSGGSRRDARADPRPTADLIAAILAEEDEDKAWEDIAVLQFRGTREVFAAARALCASAVAPERSLGAAILGQLGIPERAFPEESVALLCSLLAQEHDPAVLGDVAIALGHLGDPRAIDFLLPLVGHASAEVRHGVVFGLLTQEDPRAINALIELSTDPATDVRDWATFGLGTQIATDTPAIREALLARVSDPDFATREEALVGLARRKDPRVLGPLVQELLADEVGDLAVEAAEELADPRLCPALRQLASWWRDEEGLADAWNACECGPDPQRPATPDTTPTLEEQ